MVRLTLIAPPHPERDYPDPEGLPLGLCMLASMVRDRVDLSIIDALSLGMSVEDTVKAVEKESPDIVGISLPFSFSEKTACTIAEGIRLAMRDIPIIAGGIHATTMSDDLLRNEVADAVFLGEAEDTIVEFIDRFIENGCEGVRGNPPNGVRLLNENGDAVGRHRALIEDLDRLPYPSLDLLTGFPSGYSARILTSRGCPHRCPYCSSSAYWGHRFRAHSPGRVVEEMKRLRDTWGIRRLSLADDNFDADRERARDIARLLIDAGLGIEWGASSRPESLDEDDLRLYTEAGMTGLFLGLESGSPSVIKSIGRHHDPDATRKLITFAEGIGISVHASFMIGLPSETKADVEMTIKYAQSLGASSLGFHIFHPLPGSEYGTHPEEYGIKWELPEGESCRIGAIDTYAPIRTLYMTSFQIMDYYMQSRAIADGKIRREK
jgi:anaerobic magnesium-protoporphyrin IX monomethyl ester cyclase